MSESDSIEGMTSTGEAKRYEHAFCQRWLAGEMLGKFGVEIDVTTEPTPGSPYSTDGFRCPHGTTYWILPTPKQVAQWTADGTA